MSAPKGSMGDSRTRVLLAVVNGARTYTELIEATGLSRQPIHEHLHRLRRDGLVAFEDGTLGTLRPLVGESHEHLFESGRMGENRGGPGAASTAPTLPNAPRRR